MEICVRVRDAESTYGLVERLTEAVDMSGVVLEVDGCDVRAHTMQSSHHALVRLLHAIEERLDESEIDAVTVLLDGRAYTLARRAAAS